MLLQVVFPLEHTLHFPCHLQHIFGKSQVVLMEAGTLQKGQGPGKAEVGWVLFNHKFIYISILEYGKGRGAAQQTKNTHTLLCFGG